MPQKPPAAITFKDIWGMIFIKLQNFFGTKSQAQPQGNDAASRGTHDQIKIVSDISPNRIFNGCQERRGKHSLYSATINGENFLHETVARKNPLPRRACHICIAPSLSIRLDASLALFAHRAINP